jgi:preprotein translocase subunit YajC
MDPNSLTTFALLALMVMAFYFLIMRPQKKRQHELQRILASLAPGTRVMTSSGLFGTVVAVGERQVVLEIAPGVELTVLKQAVARIATESDEDVFYDGTDGNADEILDHQIVEPDLRQPSDPTRPATGERPGPATGPGQERSSKE